LRLHHVSAEASIHPTGNEHHKELATEEARDGAISAGLRDATSTASLVDVARLAQWTISRQHCAGSPGALPSAVATRPARHSLALNLSAKRRLRDTVGGRGIAGITRCCAICIARCRAAATTDLTRPNQSWVLRAFFARVRSGALIEIFMNRPQILAEPTRRNSAPGSRLSHGKNRCVKHDAVVETREFAVAAEAGRSSDDRACPR
jgi:hypothetical protein